MISTVCRRASSKDGAFLMLSSTSWRTFSRRWADFLRQVGLPRLFILTHGRHVQKSLLNPEKEMSQVITASARPPSTRRTSPVVYRGARGQEQDGFHGLLQAAEPFLRNAAADGVGRARRVQDPRRHRVHPDVRRQGQGQALRRHDQRRLGDAVRQVRLPGPDSPQARDVDHGATAAPPHVGSRGLRRHHRRLDVHGKGLVQGIVGDLVEGNAPEDAHVVHQHVDAAQGRCGFVHETADLARLARVGLSEVRAAAHRGQRALDLLRAGSTGAIRKRDVRAFTAERQRDGAPKAAPAARHDGDLPGQPQRALRNGILPNRPIISPRSRHYRGISPRNRTPMRPMAAPWRRSTRHTTARTAYAALPPK